MRKLTPNGKPTPWAVEYEDQAKILAYLKRRGSMDSADPADYWTTRDFETLAKARAFFVGIVRGGGGARIVARDRIRDVTPPEDRRLYGVLIWDYDYRVAADGIAEARALREVPFEVETGSVTWPSETRPRRKSR